MSNRNRVLLSNEANIYNIHFNFYSIYFPNKAELLLYVKHDKQHSTSLVNELKKIR